MVDFYEIIDVTGMSCPMPLITMSQAVDSAPAGNAIKVIGDDPVFEQGVRDFCALKQFEVLSVSPQSGRIVEIIIKV